MELGISSYAYAWAIGAPGRLPVEPMDSRRLLEKAAALNLQLVQIADNLPLHTLSPTQLDALKRDAEEKHITLEVGTRGIAPSHLDTYLRIAQRLGASLLRVVVDTSEHKPQEAEIIGTLSGFLPKLRSAGVSLAIENHDRFRARQLLEILECIGSEWVGICLDTVNSFGALEGPEVVVETLGPWTLNLHVKDFAIFRPDHNMGFTLEGRPAGQGMLDVPWLLGKLREFGRDVNALLELWPPPAETLEATIAREDAWAVASIEYLRRWI